MKVLVINGSPRGKNSTTLYNCLYIKETYGDDVKIISIGASPDRLVSDISPVTESVKEADLTVFSYPVYTFITPYQLHAVIEKLADTGVLKGRFATQITTSKHFFDTTAHAFVNENLADMGAKVIKGLSLDMDDLLCDKGKKMLRDFHDTVKFCIENDIYEEIPVLPEKPSPVFRYEPDEKTPSGGKNCVIVTAAPSENLKYMINAFTDISGFDCTVKDISGTDIKGGCLSCFSCVTDGQCVYRDGYSELLDTVNSSDITVYAFDIKNHSMGSRFKMFDDRQFCNGHRTVTMGKPVAYLVSGNLSSEHNLKNILEARADVGRNFLAGIATDENDPAAEIRKLALMCRYALENRPQRPQTFWGIGGMKIFRDMIYVMQGFMREDHNFYKKNGFYDFPQKRKNDILKMKLAGLAMKSPNVRAKMKGKLDEIMAGPYRKAVYGKDRTPDNS